MARNNSGTLPMTPAVYQILLSLADDDRHGYGIMQEVAERTGDEVQLGPGTLYRSIKGMRKVGLIEPADSGESPPDDEDRRRFYRITGAGREVLANEAKRLARLVAHAHDKHVLDEPTAV